MDGLKQNPKSTELSKPGNPATPPAVLQSEEVLHAVGLVIASNHTQSNLAMEEIGKLKEELNDISKYNAKLYDELKELKKEKTLMSSKVEKLVEKNRSLEDAQQKLVTDSEAINKAKEKLAIQVEKNNSAKFTAENEALKQNLKDLGKELEKVEAKNKKLNEIVDSLLQKNTKINEEMAKLRKEHEDLRNKFECKETRLALGQISWILEAEIWKNVLPDIEMGYTRVLDSMEHWLEENKYEQDGIAAKKRWNHLKKELNWNYKKDKFAMKILKDLRIGDAHPKDVDLKEARKQLNEGEYVAEFYKGSCNKIIDMIETARTLNQQVKE